MNAQTTEIIAAIACGEKMYRVSYFNNRTNQWYPVWDSQTYDNFNDADQAAKWYCEQSHHNVISQYVSMR